MDTSTQITETKIISCRLPDTNRRSPRPRPTVLDKYRTPPGDEAVRLNEIRARNRAYWYHPMRRKKPGSQL